MSARIFLLIGVLSLASWDAKAQYFAFGKNKVQYRNFDWSYIQSRHFDVYFTEGGEYLARFTADACEAAYETIRKDFNYEINNRISIIVMKSHNDFQQNNVIDEYLPEGVGGVTELYKNRVVLPFEGDYRKFRHVIHHELIHAVVNDMVYGGSVQNAISNNIRIQLPLWFNEGIAEYQSLEWDTNSDMFLMDAVINNYLAPIPYLYGYFAYRGGQSVWRFVSEKYGREKIGEIMGRVRALRSVDAAFRGSIGLSIEELSEKWQREQKVTYWPEIAKREDINAIMKKLTDHRKDGSNYNTSPAISPQGDKFAFITDKNGKFDIYLGSTINPGEFTKLIDGQTTPNFEELKILTPGISWSPDGSKICIATKAGEQDAVMIIDVRTKKTEKLTFELDGIFTTKWSPDGKKIAFVGHHDYKSDIYVYDFATNALVNLTNDVFSDSDPIWTNDGKRIIFASDRQNYLNVNSRVVPIAKDKAKKRVVKDAEEAVFKMRLHDYSQLDLYELVIGENKLRRLTATQGIDETSPVPSPDDKKLLFISDANGIYNIYELQMDIEQPLASYKTDSGQVAKARPVTNLLSGIRQISISRDGSKLLGVGLDYGGFDIYMMRTPFERRPKDVLPDGSLEPTIWGKQLIETQRRKFYEVTGLDRQQSVPVASLFNPTTSASEMSHDRADEKSTNATTKADGSTPTSENAQDTTKFDSATPIDVRTFVFDRGLVQSFNAAKEKREENSPAKKPPKRNLDESGEYRVRKYKVNFSPDIVYGGASYDAVWGAQGSGIFAFSDLLGNHQISVFTNLQFDLQNSNYGISYAYLAERIDYSVSAYHTARFLGILDENNPAVVNFFRFRVYGATLGASYPMSRFNRLDFSAGYLTLSKENLDGGPGNDHVSFIYPTITFTHDDSRPFLYAPIDGSRWAISFSGTAFSRVKFGTILADYRRYYDLGGYYSFAMRFSGATSFGPTPQKFFIGGTENWINRRFENNAIPISDVQDFIFTTPAVPLRGYNFNRQNGTNFALANFELRYPFLQYLAFGPVPIPFYYLQGVIFLDIGGAWSDRSFRGAIRNARGELQLNDLLVGYGWGFRTVFFGLVLRYDMAWAYNLVGSSSPRHYVSFGADF
ncbi:MAG: DPP IV N-terminal domain-containing protein [Chloroherpetonaceae bacterium]|nr:DPP IV N-terminal domain-containing protein [Chloroherpetonaceae bacterium]MDW8436517.1 DPP IV N-terminal domain-containing protein [Chloroherpetonaceae bacterium]